MSKKKMIVVWVLIYIGLFGLAALLGLCKKKYNIDHYLSGLEKIDNGDYAAAVEEFKGIQAFRNSRELMISAEKGKIYNEACKDFEEKRYEIAIEKFKTIPNYLNSEEYCNEAMYQLATDYYTSGSIEKARQIFSLIADYKDSSNYLAKIDIQNAEISKARVYEKAIRLFANGDYEAAKEEFEFISDYKDSSYYFEECNKRIKRKQLNNSIFVGINCSGAISQDGGKVYCAGKNFFGQLDTEKWGKMVSIDGYNTLTIGIDENKNAFVAGKYDLTHNWEGGKTVDFSDWKGIKDVAAGEQFVIALKDDGKVLFGGLDEYDCKKEVEEWEKIIAIEAGFDFAVGLTEDSELVFAGRAQKIKEDYLKDKGKWKNIVNIAASGGNSESNYITYGHVVGLQENGDVIALGDNNYGQCNVSNWSGISKIVAGDWFTVGLTDNETLIITGRDVQDIKGIDYEKVDRCTGIKDVGAGFGATIYVDKDGKYDAFGFIDNGWPELLEKLNH